jgi:hypothetical protein
VLSHAAGVGAPYELMWAVRSRRRERRACDMGGALMALPGQTWQSWRPAMLQGAAEWQTSGGEASATTSGGAAGVLCCESLLWMEGESDGCRVTSASEVSLDLRRRSERLAMLRCASERQTRRGCASAACREAGSASRQSGVREAHCAEPEHTLWGAAASREQVYLVRVDFVREFSGADLPDQPPVAGAVRRQQLVREQVGQRQVREALGE